LDIEAMTDPHQPPYFDSARGAWILTRYADVLAALQHPHLWPVGGGDREIDSESRDEAGRLKLRTDVLARFSQAHMAEWRPRMESEAERILQALPVGRPVDLFREFALPWGLTLAMLATRADPAGREKLGALSTRVFAATGAADDSPVKADAAQATAELECIFTHVPLGEPMFVALSQTTPRLLASCWFALVSHPLEYGKLRARPDLIPSAVEELLRYSGIVRRVYRRSTAAMELGGAAIPQGALLALMLATANRDAAQFPDPGRLDVTRAIGSHVSLGNGRNSCVGGNPIRMAVSVATTVLVRTFAAAELTSQGEWRTGSGFCFPAAVEVTLLS
jgi:cytochrome P450